MFPKAALFAAVFTALVALGAMSTAVGGSCLPKAGKPSDGSGIAVSVKDCAFGPTILHAPVGALVTWTNEDFLPHAVAGAGWSADTEPFGTFNPGTSVSYRFTSSGIYTYMCHVHPGMTGIAAGADPAGTGLRRAGDGPAPGCRCRGRSDARCRVRRHGIRPLAAPVERHRARAPSCANGPA
jgi:plastocyanin